MTSPARPRILVVAPRYPYPPWRGDQVRVFRLVEALASHAEVRILTFGEGKPMPLQGVSVRSVRSGLARHLLANLRAPSPLLPGQVRLFLDAAMSRAVAEEVESWRPDAMHVALSRMAAYMPSAAPFHRHLDFTDSLALNMSTRAEAHRGPARLAFSLEARLVERYESRMAALADSCSVVSAADRNMPGLSKAVVIPNGVDPDAFPYEEPDEDPDPVLVFFGNLGYFHNVEPTRFIAEEVLPAARRWVPGVSLRLVGARPAAAVRRLASLDGVHLAADVPDMALELRRAAIAVLPTFSGSGIKNKVLEAFCVGLPVITNDLGIQGVEGAVPGQHFLRADDREAMAEAIAALMSDSSLRRRLASAAHGLVLEHYTWGRQARVLLDLYGLRGAEA